MKQRVADQLGRKPQGKYWIHKTCPWGYPIVLKNHPYEGAISPTLYWLSCPYLVKFVSGLEAEGMVGEYNQRIIEDPEFKRKMENAHKSYSKERSELIEPDIVLDDKVLSKLRTSGVGGSESWDGAKCLHMHLGHFLANGENPIGEEVWEMVTPWKAEDCPENCPPVPTAGHKPLAVIDAGSNTCRLLIAGFYPQPLKLPIISEGEDGYLQAMLTEVITTEAGRDIETGREKTRWAVERFLSLIEEFGAELVGGVATGIWRHVGTPHDKLKVISGRDEANFSYLGAIGSLDLKGEVAVCDLGGGSLEIVRGTGTDVRELDSFDVGFWSVAKALNLQKSSLSEVDAQRIRDYVKEKLGSIEPVDHMVFIGGTATTLAGLKQELDEYDAFRIHGFEIDPDFPFDVDNLPSWAAERKASIAIGAEIIKAVLELAGKSSAVVSDLGLMAGILCSSY